MIKTNLKLALRNILRNKLYAGINIIGLGVASAFCILVYLYVKNERSFDNFNHDQDQLFRLEQTNTFESPADKKPSKNFFSFLMKDAEQKNMIQTPTSMGPDLKRNFPEIENAVRFAPMGDETVKVGNQSFKEGDRNLTYADADFFQVFNYPLVVGDPATVISGLNQAAISQKLAKKYFGSEDPIGRVISFPNESNQPPITINGVFKDFPANSSFQYDLVMNMESNPDYKDDMARGVNSFSNPLVLKLKKGTNVAVFQAKLNAFGKEYFRPLYETSKKYDPKASPKEINFFLRPFAEAHYNQAAGWYHYSDLKNIYQLVCLTVVILLIACLNYVLLTLTNTVSRSQDVGIRKTIGAERLQIVLQYYTETQVIAFMAVVVGFVLSITCLPLFERLTGAPIDLTNIPFTSITLYLFLLAITMGLLAGIYPALVMSGLKPSNIMRSFSAYKINPVLSRLLIIIQFSVCVVLIISALVINRQMHYVNDASMGFDKDQVLILHSPYNWLDKPKMAVLKQRMFNYAATDRGIRDITSASFSFAGYNNNAYEIGGEKVMVEEYNVDFNYFTFLKIPIVQGRSFSPSIASDSAKIAVTGTHKFSSVRHTFVANQSLYKMLGKPEIGVYNDQMGGILIGVCKDYHAEDLTKKIEPTYFVVNKNPADNIWIRLAGGQNVPDEIARIKANWDKFTGNLPFVYNFMDEEVAKSYDAYLRWMTTITVSCIVAIILACLGLFGLSGITTINRTKEIGIRKVLGASVSNLFLLVNRETFLLALGSFLLALPVAAYLADEWLLNFAYRIHLDWPLFSIAALVSITTAIAAVSYHTIKAAMANPVKSLRSE
jgi:putative ABC transport system permease protein